MLQQAVWEGFFCRPLMTVGNLHVLHWGMGVTDSCEGGNNSANLIACPNHRTAPLCYGPLGSSGHG